MSTHWNIDDIIFKPLWCRYIIWRHRSRSTLVQVVASCFLSDGSNLLPEPMSTKIKAVVWHSPGGNCIANAEDICIIGFIQWKHKQHNQVHTCIITHKWCITRQLPMKLEVYRDDSLRNGFRSTCGGWELDANQNILFLLIQSIMFHYLYLIMMYNLNNVYKYLRSYGQWWI